MTTVKGSRYIDFVEETWSTDVIESLYGSKKLPRPEDFRDAVHGLYGNSGQLFLTGSGRQSLSIFLHAIKATSARSRILLSSFNCRIVRDTACKAGLSVETFDFAGQIGKFDWGEIGERLTDDCLAVVVPHFYGIPSDFRPLLPYARKKGIWIIEDCAHAFGARIADIPAGTLGDASIFSFNYDKPLSLSGGGLLLVNNPKVKIDETSFGRAPSAEQEYRQFHDLIAYLRYRRSFKKHPKLIARIGNKLGVAPYAFPKLPTGIGALRAALGIWQLERWNEVAKRRNSNAAALAAAAGGAAWYVGEGVVPSYLKQRIVLDHNKGQEIAAKCRQSGISVANANWPIIIDEANAVARPLAHQAAQDGLDFPVHQNLGVDHLRFMADCLRQAGEDRQRV